jgi:hypothetical protein
MLTKLRDSVLQVRSCIGIEVCILSPKKMSINAISLKLDRGTIVKESEYHEVEDLEELRKKVNIHCPIALCITGKGVLYKKTKEKEVPSNPVQLLLPTANPDDFYIQNTDLANSIQITIIRKEILDSIVSDFISHSYKIISISIGGFENLQDVIRIINTQDDHIHTTNYRLQLAHDRQSFEVHTKEIDTDKYGNIEYNLANQYVFSKGIVAFAAAQNLMIQFPNDIPSLILNNVKNERSEYYYSKLFKSIAVSCISVLFILLMTNFLVNEYYSHKIIELQNALNIYKVSSDKTTAWKTNIKSKAAFLASTGWDKSQKLSFYSDRIAALIPGSILLSEMNVFPLVSKDAYENQALHFEMDTIEISGTCDDPTDISMFKANLEASNHFKKIWIKDYVFKKEINSGTFKMQIIIE